MKHRRTFSSDDPSLDMYIKNVQIVSGMHHKNIAHIHYYKNYTRTFLIYLFVEFHMCGRSSEI